MVTPVTISDWFMKHINGNPGGHALFKKVFDHLHLNDIEDVQEMRKNGFKNYYCDPCMTEEMGCGKDHDDDKKGKMTADSIMQKMVMPPRVLHIPKLGFTYSHGTDQALKYYKVPEQVKSGIIISSVSRVGLGFKCGLNVGDYVYKVNSTPVSNYGEVWDGVKGVSLNVLDVLSSLEFGGLCVLGVCGSCGVRKDVSFVYSELRGAECGELRLLDSVLDAGVLNGEVLCVRGVTLKPLRLNDVVHYKMINYMGDEHAHKFRIMVSNIDSHSDAYHAKSIRPGDVLQNMNGQPIPNNWADFVKVLNAHPDDQPLHISTESSKIIIL